MLLHRLPFILVSFVILLNPVLGLSAEKISSKKFTKSVASQNSTEHTLKKLPEVNTTIGRATITKLLDQAERVAIGDPRIADFTVIGPKELYILGKSVGNTNLIYWDARGQSRSIDIIVSIDVEPLAKTIKDALPNELDINISSAANSIVFTGYISNALAAEATMNLAQAYVRNLNRSLSSSGTSSSGTSATASEIPSATSVLSANTAGSANNARIINLLKVRDPQQVMLEVRIAEVSKTLMEKLGVSFFGGTEYAGQGFQWAVPTNPTSGGLIGYLLNGTVGADINLQKNDGLVKILAAPTIIAVSGQEASFLVGGKVFLPVQSVSNGAPTVTLQEQDYGIGLRFVPTVLDKGRINLKVTPEVSELSKEPIRIVSSGTATVLPSFTTRRVSTTVQLGHGQNLVIGGLLKNNVVETVKSIPGLGQLPIIGALFRSSEFATDQTELIIVVRPTLVEATDKMPVLPTDNFIPPSRGEFFFEGKMEGSPLNSSNPNSPVK